MQPGWLGALSLLVLLLPMAAAGNPKVAYWLHCAGCHRLDGSGVPPEIPTLIDVPGRIAALPGGRAYLIRVPGVAQAGLSDGELAEVLNFMLETFSRATLPAGFESFTAAEVAAERPRILADPLAHRARLLETRSP